MSNSALILGGSGFSGSAFVSAFQAAGWEVRLFKRGQDPAAAARGVKLIVNAMNPPNYHDWARLIPQITETTMQAARASGARVLIPGNVYVFGAQPGPWSAATPHNPCSRKGRVRADMELAWRHSGLPVTMLRAGDFLDGTKPGLVMGKVVLAGIAKGKITAMGGVDVPRAYAYLPDLARAAVLLSGRDDLPQFADIPFPGHTFSLTDLQDEIARQTGGTPRITRFPWRLMGMTAPFWELARELGEMRYLYDHPHMIDGEDFRRLLPDFEATPFAQVVSGYLPANH